MAINQLLPAKKNIAVPRMKYSCLFLENFNKLLSFKNKRLRKDYAYKDDMQKLSAGVALFLGITLNNGSRIYAP